MTRRVLALNAGSSSIKFARYRREGAALARELRGQISGISTAPRLVATGADGAVIADYRWPDGARLGHAQLIDALLAGDLIDLEPATLDAIGHRIVHGGKTYSAPVRLDAPVIDALDALVPLAPLHQPHNLDGVRALARRWPDVPQVACFDTAFHHSLPAIARRFPINRALYDEGFQRYGFHGLSYQSVYESLKTLDPALAGGRLIIAHLGAGASLCAMRDGRSIDTTMGFTALDGLMMGTRSGSIDPGLVLHLQLHKGMSATAVSDLLYHRSGLLGVSGLSPDMQVLMASDLPEAQDAIALFIWRAAREAGALLPALGGLDGLIFTAGIGEHDATVRAGICERLGFTGLALDPAANARHATVISTAASAVTALVIPTDEEAMIARQALAVMGTPT